MIVDRDDPCGNPHRGCSARDVLQDHCVGADANMVVDPHAAKHFSTCAEIYVSSNDRRPGLGAADPNRHLLEDQAIGSDDGIRKDDNAVGMGDQKPTTDIAIQRNISTVTTLQKRCSSTQYLPSHLKKTPRLLAF